MCAALKRMSAEFTVKISSEYGRTDGGMLKDVISGTVDAALQAYYLRDYWKMQAYPFREDSLKIISLKDSVKHSDRFLQIFNVKVLVLILATCCVCIISLKYVLQQPTSEAALDFVRMFVTAATLKQPENLSKKLFFLTLMFVIFIISSYVQSDLTASHTVPNHMSSIESTEDLINANLTIYGHRNLKDLIIWDAEINNHFQEINNFAECLNRVVFEHERAACMYPKMYANLHVYENETIHISKDHLAQRLATYIFSEDSPLLHKFNSILSRLLEGGFLELLIEREERYFEKNLDEKNDVKGLNIYDLILISNLIAF